MHAVGDSDGAVTMKRPIINAHPLPYICDRCGKRFASGQALGGHRTFHNRNTSLSAAAAPAPAASIACPVCSAKFRSLKSVYGHMRAHRHRGWRGMQPPPAAAQAISSTFPTSPSSTISEISSSDLREKSASVREGNPSTVETNRCSVRRNRKTRRLADLEPKSAAAAAVAKGHVCSTFSGVSFPTRYALGGHVSVHNRTKNNRKNQKKARDDKLENSTSMIRRSVLKFDLNELPPIEDDDI